MDNLSIEYVDINTLKTYANNAKIHTAEQIEQIKNSIRQFGMNDPIAVWQNNEIIEGHGRLMACMELGYKEVPVIRLDSLTDEQRRAYMLIHNKLTMNTGFEFDVLNSELEKLSNVPMEVFGFQRPSEVVEAEPVDDGSEDAAEREDDNSDIRKVICPRCGRVVSVRRIKR